LNGPDTHSRGDTSDAFFWLCLTPNGAIRTEPDGGSGAAGRLRGDVAAGRDRHREDDETGLLDFRLRPSPRRAPVREIERMLGLYRELYRGFTVKHFHEQLGTGSNHAVTRPSAHPDRPSHSQPPDVLLHVLANFQSAVLVVNEGAGRQQIHGRRVLGTFNPISQVDVVRNVAGNLSRQPEKLTATDLLSSAAQVCRSTLHNLRAGAEPQERAGSARPTLDRAHDRHVAERSPAIRRLMEHVRQVRHVAEQARTWRHDRGQGLSR
jgi:hypothetical protein